MRNDWTANILPIKVGYSPDYIHQYSKATQVRVLKSKWKRKRKEIRITSIKRKDDD